MDFIEILLLALSLSADSFAVSMGGSVTLGRVSLWRRLQVALVFGIMQAALMAGGYFLAHTVLAYIGRIAHIIGFVILMYIGVSMIVPVIRGRDSETVDLAGFRKMLLAAVATSIDAFAVGVSLAMSGVMIAEIAVTLLTVFAVTLLASLAGISGGSMIGCRFGKCASLAGGIVLILIALNLLFGLV